MLPFRAVQAENAASAEQIRVVNTLHESFARRLSDSLGTYLRTVCEMNLVTAEQLRYSEFLGRVTSCKTLGQKGGTPSPGFL